MSGDTVVLHAGVYGAQGVTTTASKNGVTWQADGEALLRGKTRIRGAGSKWVGVVFDGPTGNVGGNASECSPGESVVVDVGASNVELDHVEAREGLGHAAIYVTTGTNIRVHHAYVHDSGCTDPGAANLDHGIYWHDGTGSVESSLIARNIARGVQIYPGPATVTVAHNTIINNGRAGVQPDGGQVTIANNVIVGNGSSNGTPGIYCRAGSHKTFNNLLWANAGGDVQGTSCVRSGDVHADPLFLVDGWHIGADSPAIGLASPFYVLSPDLDGEPRDVTPDSGADEYVPPTPVSTVVSNCG